MFYAILCAVFIVLLVIGIACSLDGDFEFLVPAIIVFFAIIVATCCGQYKSITSPDYEDVLIEEVSIPEIDSKKSKTAEHDVVYVDAEKEIIYIDAETYNDNDKIVEFVEESETPKVGIYNCIPDNNFNSVDLRFNRAIKYIIYVPEGFEVNTLMKLK